jgi:patatin-like phospholipase/acyl hydrolase
MRAKGEYDMVSILSIDGGGIRGIIPAAFLAAFEKRTGKPICELFDIIAGTSTGGILAAALTVPGSGGKPKYTVEQVRAAYFEHGGEIFHHSLIRTVTTLGGLIRPIYSPRVLDRMLEQYLGDARLHTTLTEILVTAYDMTSDTPWFFKTSFAKEHRDDPENDPLLSQVVRATAAAPTYFPPLAMEGHCLVDGGVFATNPAVCAYAQARVMYPGEKEFLVVSLGTGLQIQARSCSEVKNWGILHWAVPISGVMLNSSNATVNYQMRAITGTNYIHFQVPLAADATGMDDASDANMHMLDDLAQKAVTQESEAIDQVCRMLKKTSSRALTFKSSGVSKTSV